MECPECRNDMPHVGETAEDQSLYHCRHCGTMQAGADRPAVTVPRLVEQARAALRAHDDLGRIVLPELYRD